MKSEPRPPAPPAFEKLDSITFSDFWAQQDLLARDPVIDLRTVQLVTPSALVQLAAAIHSFSNEGRHPTILLEDSPVLSYVDRARFLEAIESVATILPSSSEPFSHIFARQRGSNPMLVEVTRIDSGAALPSVLDQIVSALRQKLGYRKHDAFDVATAVSEVCQNTFDHNEATCGFLAMQGYGKGTKRFLEIGISDHGAGLRETLRQNPKNGFLANDSQAIHQAIILGTSQYDDPTRGTGLYHLFEITYRHAGTVQIWSGASKVRFRMDKKKGWSFAVREMPGVHVALMLHTKRA